MSHFHFLNANETHHELCSVCHSKMFEDDNCYMLPECGHCFHTDCIISWLRSDMSYGRCPLCSDRGANHSYNTRSFHNLRTQFALIKSYIKTPKCPLANNLFIQNEFKKYHKFQDKLNLIKHELTEFNKNKNTFSYCDGEKYRRNLNRKKHTCQHQIFNIERTVGSIPVTPLIVSKTKHYFHSK